MWVRFVRDYDCRPMANVVIAFRAGREELVRRICGDAAVLAGAAVVIPNKRKDDPGALRYDIIPRRKSHGTALNG